MLELSRDQIMEGLQSGKTLVIDRDSLVLPVVAGMVDDGLVKTRLVQFDEQSSGLRVSLPCLVVARDPRDNGVLTTWGPYEKSEAREVCAHKRIEVRNANIEVEEVPSGGDE